MKPKIREALKQYFDNIDSLDAEISALEEVVQRLQLDPSILDDILFWNHYLSLIDRVYHHTQNNLEFEDSGEIPEHCLDIARNLLRQHSILKDYDITDFEIYLIAIYFAQDGKEV